MTETTLLDFMNRNTFSEYAAIMNSVDMQAFFKDVRIISIYIGVNKNDSKRAIVIFQGAERVCFDTFNKLENRLAIESTGHIYNETLISRCVTSSI